MVVSHGKRLTWLKTYARFLDNSLKNPQERRFYGRRVGRPLNQSRQEALDKLLPALSISDALLTEKGDLSPEGLFGAPVSECWFEIGFGTGEHLSGLMRQNPDIGYLGAEPFANGMAAFLKDIQDEPHERIRVITEDAMFLANSLADNTLDGMYVLNPDPWHKKRHHKRRIINQDNLDCFARILKPGAPLIMSTDVPYLAEWMVTQASMHDAFEWDAWRAKDWWDVPEGWIHTAYETKKAKGADRMVYLNFVRK